MNMKVVIFLSFDLEIDIHSPKDVPIQVLDVFSDENKHCLEVFLLLNR